MNIFQRASLGWQIMKGQLDVRDGSLVSTLLRGIWPSVSGEPPKRQGKQHLDSYNQMPWARAPIERIASSVSTLCWKLYYRTGPGKDEMGRQRIVRDRGLQRMGFSERKSAIRQGINKGDLVEVDDHIFLDALDKGTVCLSGNATWKLASCSMDLVGETFWMKERNAVNAPIAYWHIPHYWVIDTPTPTFRFYKVSFRAWQGYIPDSEIVYFKNPDPVNPYGRGTGMAQVLGDEYESDEYAAKFIKQFFFNRATPDFMVFPKGDMNNMGPEQVQALERKWLDSQQGFWRAFKPQFMSREVGIYEFQKNFQHLQMLQLRQHSRDTALQTIGINPEILGVLENSNRATIEGAFYAYFKLSIEPRAEFWRSEFQQKVISDYDPRLIIDYVSPVQEDREFTLSTYQAKPATVTIDEWRALQGLPPLGGPEGEMHFEPINETLHSDYGEQEEPPVTDSTGNPIIGQDPEADAQDEKPTPAKIAQMIARLDRNGLKALHKLVGR